MTSNTPSNGLSLIIEGRVIVATTLEDGSQIVAGIFSSDAFFGEEALLGTNREQATALEKTTLMSWPRAEIEELVERQPRLGGTRGCRRSSTKKEAMKQGCTVNSK